VFSVQKDEKIVGENRRVTLDEIQKKRFLICSSNCPQDVISNQSNYRKVCARRLTKSLTEEHNEKNRIASEKCFGSPTSHSPLGPKRLSHVRLFERYFEGGGGGNKRLIDG